MLRRLTREILNEFTSSPPDGGKAPEINASESVSALLLLAGMLAVLLGRRT